MRNAELTGSAPAHRSHKEHLERHTRDLRIVKWDRKARYAHDRQGGCGHLYPIHQGVLHLLDFSWAQAQHSLGWNLQHKVLVCRQMSGQPFLDRPKMCWCFDLQLHVMLKRLDGGVLESKNLSTNRAKPAQLVRRGAPAPGTEARRAFVPREPPST